MINANTALEHEMDANMQVIVPDEKTTSST